MSYTKKGTTDNSIGIGRIKRMQIIVITDIGQFSGVCPDENSVCDLLSENDTITDVVLDIINSGIKERIEEKYNDDIYFGT